MAARILVVDRNQAFATMLRDMLEIEGGYHVQVSHAGSEALSHLQRADYDLTIVDVDLDPADMPYQTLVQSIRRIRPTMRLMLIPLMGQDLPAEARRLDIQGTLSKPFFADDLLPNIQNALAREVQSPAPPPPQPAPTSTPPRPVPVPRAGNIQSVLSDLARETRANTVLLISTATGKSGIVGHVSTLSPDRVETLARLSTDIARAARPAARFLGQSDEPFEHNMFENESLRLYIMAFARDWLLVTVTAVSTPLGTIRHNLRRAVRDLVGQTLT